MLADVTHRQTRCANDFAAIGLLFLQEKFEERRLSRTVAADEADLLAGIVLPRHAAKNVVRAVTLLDVFEAIKHGLTVNLTSCAWQSTSTTSRLFARRASPTSPIRSRRRSCASS